MLALLVALSLSQVTPDSRVTRVERVPGGRMEGGRGGVKGWAFFEAFPVGGAGTFGACSTTPPTGAKGEALTFSRTGNATCTATATGGLATSGIANGDLVVMSANQPRVEYDSAGTLGLLVESARTNSLVRSESIDNAAWTKAAGATVTADYATAPDGTLTADRLVYNAVSSYVLGSLSTGGLTYTTSVYLRGTSSSGSIDMCAGGAAGQCVVCSYVADSWSRCVWAHTLAIASNFFIGCDVPTKGGACSPAGDVLVWGMQGEAGAYATSYIPTTSAAVTRNVESADFVVSLSPTASTGVSTAATITTASTATWTSGGGTLAPILTSGAAGGALNGALYWWTYANTGPSAAQDSAGVVSAGLAGYFPGFATLNATSNRVSASHSGSAWTLCQNGTCSTSGSSTLGTPAFTRIMLGNATGAAANQNDRIVSRVCVETNSTRCR